MPSSGKPELQQFFQDSIKEMNTMPRELKCGNPTPLSQTTPFILYMSMPENDCDGGHTQTWLWERFLKNRSQGSSISLESHPFSSFPSAWKTRFRPESSRRPIKINHNVPQRQNSQKNSPSEDKASIFKASLTHLASNHLRYL